MKAPSPKFSEPQSSVQISGRSASTWATRSAALAMSVPLPAGRRVVRIEDEVAAHAGGEVDDDVDARTADQLHRLAIVLELAPGLAGGGVADMKMGDGGARLGRLDRRVGDLARRHRNGRMLADGVAGAR